MCGDISRHFGNVRSKKVTIIGAGNTGCALAADLGNRGFSVCLYAHPDHSERLQNIYARGKMTFRGIIAGECTPSLMTMNEHEALEYADNVIFALPSYAQEEMFERLAPHIRNRHRIINLNGNFSSYILAAMLRDTRPVIVETNCAPHASRACCSGNVDILGVKDFFPIAPVNSHFSEQDKQEIEAILPSRLEWHPDVIAVSMQAYNGVLHPAPMILNAGRIEEGIKSFRFYAEGISTAVGEIVEKIDKERLQIARLYGHNNLRTTLEALQAMYQETEADDISCFARQAKVYQTVDAPTSIGNRYLSEDVPFILVPWYQLGQRAGFEASTIRSIIELSSVLHRTDYLKTGRTLDKMKLPPLHAPNEPQQDTIPDSKLAYVS